MSIFSLCRVSVFQNRHGWVCGYVSSPYIRYWVPCIPHSQTMCNRVVFSPLLVFCLFFTHATSLELSGVKSIRTALIRTDQPMTLSSSREALFDNIPRFKDKQTHTESHYGKASGISDMFTVPKRQNTPSVKNVPIPNTTRSVGAPVIITRIDPGVVGSVVPLDDYLFFTSPPVDSLV